VTFLKLGEISTTQEQFTAKVLVTARWREPNLDSLHSGNDQVQVVSVSIDLFSIMLRTCHVRNILRVEIMTMN